MARIPDPEALRRDRKDDLPWIILVAGQTVEQVPVWPLVGQSEREAALWEMYWAIPQAILWMQNGLEIEVGLFVRRLGEVELSGANASRHSLLLRQMEGLLLTVSSMHRVRVRIEPSSSTPKKSSARHLRNHQAQNSLIRSRLKGVQIPFGEMSSRQKS